MKTRTFIITSLLIATLNAQPTLELVNNVTRVASDRKSGAIFSIEVNGREYWLTVKHIVNGGADALFSDSVAVFTSFLLTGLRS